MVLWITMSSFQEFYFWIKNHLHKYIKIMHEYWNDIHKLWNKICDTIIHIPLYYAKPTIRPSNYVQSNVLKLVC